MRSPFPRDNDTEQSPSSSSPYSSSSTSSSVHATPVTPRPSAELTRGPVVGATTTTTTTSTSTASSRSSQSDMATTTRDARGAVHIPAPSASVCPTDQESIDAGAPRVAGLSAKEVDKRSLDYLMRSGLAGGLAGCAAKTVVGPLDRVKILFQTSNPQFAKYASSRFGVVSAMQSINQSEGMRGLFKGHSATLLRIFPYAAIKFLAYEQVRAALIPNKQKETPLRRLLSGSLAGVCSVFCTYPLELMRVRLAFETKHHSRGSSLLRICRQIYQEGSPTASPSPSSSSSSAAATTTTTTITSSSRTGIANFYRGFSPTLIGMLPYAGVSFLTHDTVGDWLRLPLLAPYTTIPSSSSPPSSSTSHRSQRPQLTASAQLLSGGIAGVVSQTSSYPFEVIRRRMQVSGALKADGGTVSHRLNIPGTARKIWMETGFRGFWVGLTIGYMKVIPMAATSFYVYERSKWWLGI